MLKKYHPPKTYYVKTILAVNALFFVAAAIVIFLLPRPQYQTGFATLADLNAYAQQVSETIKPDTDNTIKPDFSSYYNTLKPTWGKKIKEKINRILQIVSLAKPPLWSAGFFKKQLETLIAMRTADGHKDAFICKLIPTAQSKFIVFGTIQGAYHSLVRNLNQLNSMGIITQDLKITNPDYFIIFMGDVVDRSPMTMETLSVLMLLLQQNPKNVIYLKGNHESNNYWQEHTLKTELQIRAQHLSTDVIPLVNEVNALFNTLPLACYITTINNRTNEFIRISDSGREQNEALIEQKFASFLLAKDRGTHGYLNLKADTKLPESDDAVDIKVILKGEKKRETFQPSIGLRLLPPDVGSTAWNPISCPTTVYQKALKFVHDAFVIITPAEVFDQWTITLYNREVNTKDPFKTKTYSLLSGAELGDGQATTAAAAAPTPKPTPAPTLPAPAAAAAQAQTPTTPTPETKPTPPAPAPPILDTTTTNSMDTTITSTASEIAKQAHDIAQQAQNLARAAETLIKQKSSPTPPTQTTHQSPPIESTEQKPPTQTIPGTAFERVE